MKIFLTGGTGFIGSHFINKAQSLGAKVVALRRSDKSQPRISLNEEPVWITKGLDMVTSEDLEGVDVIVHLAAHSMSPPYDSIENCMYWNLMAPIKLFKTAIDANVKRFVISGSCFEYGESGMEYEKIPVDAPLKPTLTYSASKAAASIAFYQMAVECNLILSIIRIFHVFGPGESENRLWPSLKRAAEKGLDFPMTLGEQVRDFIHVKDVCDYLWKECNNQELREGKPKIENLGSGKPTTILEFSEFWWKNWNATGKLLVGKLPYREGEVMNYVPLI